MIETEENAAERVRDNAWLAERLRLIWDMHFSDVAQGFPIVTRFGIRAQRRFGSIAARNKTTTILINQLFADPFVPEYVVDGTLGHELAHYAHGFGSGLPRLYTDPHRGGVVDKELEKRGLGEVNRKAEVWREAHWDAFYAARCTDLVSRKAARTQTSATLWNTLLCRPEARPLAELREMLWRLAPRLGYTAQDTLPFTAEWLHATRRQSGTSYWFAKSRVVRLHGLLADKRVPLTIVEFELAYWLARCQVGERWPNIHAVLSRAGMDATAQEALYWRKRAWTAFRNRNHPLG
ncbi:MAG TPA: hypothetical protein VKU00_07775 [Chthonomonadaceae bacterium]|nr:hypothetical protein [Chthonomonadaceae bacterium]